VSTRQWMLESNDATSTEKQWTTKLGSRQQSVIAWAGNIASRWSALEVVAPAGPAPRGWPDPDDMCVRLICSISRLVVSHTVVRSALHRCPTSLRSLSADVEFVVRLSTKVPPAAFLYHDVLVPYFPSAGTRGRTSVVHRRTFHILRSTYC